MTILPNDQRLAIYQQRNDLLDLESIHDDLIFMTISAIRSLLKKSLPENDNNPAKHILEVLKQSSDILSMKILSKTSVLTT